MARLIDLTGRKFGRITVIKRAQKRVSNQIYWECRCECGNIKDICGTSLREGLTKSCGCIQRESVIKKNKTHGLVKDPLHHVWNGMKQRCHNKNNAAYYNYGGRGITVCKSWRGSFMAFYKWAMKNGYKKGLTIDRIDNDGGYRPGNCRWATRRVQRLNSRSAINTTVRGEKLNLTEIAMKYNFKYFTIVSRYKRGWRNEKLIQPLREWK